MSSSITIINHTDAEALWVVRDRIRFMGELGRTQTPPAGPPSDAEIAAVMAACARHGIAILGGPPA